MKVLFVFGGLPHYYNKILNRLNSSGISVTVVAPEAGGKTLGSGVHQSEENIDFKLIRLKEKKDWYRKPALNNLTETILSENPQYVIIGWPYYLKFLFDPFSISKIKKAGIKILAKEIPFSIPSYDESFENFNLRSVESQKTDLIFRSKLWFSFMKTLRKRLYNKVCDGAVVYIDKGIEILSSYGMLKKNITVTYNSPDTDEIFSAIEKVKLKGLEKTNKIRLIHVGRLVSWKRVDHLIEATENLISKYPDIELVIIGKGEEEENLKNLVKTKKLESKVIFKGAIYDEEVLAKEMLSSDIYVLAGMGGLSINEAMCHELPIVCSVCDGTEKHLVFDDINGKIFIPDNIQSLTDAIDSILKDPAKKLEMGKASLKIIKENINVETVVNGYKKAFSNFAN